MADQPLNAKSNGTTAIPALPGICYTLQRKVDTFLAESTGDKAVRSAQGHTKVAMEVIGEALRRYGPEHLSLSYNGGKDCLVLLVLILACLPSWASSAERELHTQPHQSLQRPLQAIYIVSRDPFAEVEEFVTSSAKDYHLQLHRYALSMRPALDAYLADEKDVKAILMGTRRTDPHSEDLGHFSPTDPDWPQFMRVNPVIDWHYADVWTFLRHLQIPYCPLYDQGFTSLGGTTNTRPNPVLAADTDATSFRPAYELVHDDEERLGRDR